MNNNDLIIGCDPEVLFLKDDGVVSASEIIKVNRFTGGFGCDGYEHIAEIRPGYSDNLIELIAKMEHVIQQGEKKLELGKRIDSVVAGHHKAGFNLGGHIHFRTELPTTSNGKQDRHGLLLELDFYLEDCLEELVAPKEERQRRLRHPRFGHKYTSGNGDAIRADYPDPLRFEYRPPGSWVISPEMSFAYLFVGKAVAALFKAGKLPTHPEKLTTAKYRKYHLKKLADEAVNLCKTDDMALGMELLEGVLETNVNWDSDIREGWKL